MPRRIVALAGLASIGLAAHCGQPFEAVADAGGDAQEDATVRFAGPVTLFTGQTLPRGIAVDANRLFWVVTNPGGAGPGAIRMAPKDQSGGVTTLATNQPSPLDIAVDADGVFWSVNTVSASTAPQCLAMTSSKQVPNDAACVTSGSYSTARLAINGTYLVLLLQGPGVPTIGVSTKGPASPLQTKVAQGPSFAIAASSTDAYLGNANGMHIDEMSLTDLAFGAAGCMNGCGTAPAFDIIADDVVLKHLFWVTSAGEIISAPFPPPTHDGTQIGTMSPSPQRMARDATYVYVTSSAGIVVAFPAAGGAAITLASGENGPFGIAADGTNVYWTCADGTIRAAGAPPH